jgi:dihydropteroate synthase
MNAKFFAGLSLDRPRIFGIINVTPDSFSDGGDTFSVEQAVRRGQEMINSGADVLDIGGESTRPGAELVTEEEEISRTEPVVRALAEMGAVVSIDSRRSKVMAAAIEAGAKIVNDVSALTGDPDSIKLISKSGLSVILMHMQGDPSTMQKNPYYDNPATEILNFLKKRILTCQEAGIDSGRIAVDPGIGFGKTLNHNLDILAKLGLYKDIGSPVMLGASRKSFIGMITPSQVPKDRVPGSLAAVLSAWANGVQLFRVHDVAETRQALDVWRAIEKN